MRCAGINRHEAGNARDLQERSSEPRLRARFLRCSCRPHRPAARSVADAERELAFKSRFVSNLVAADAGASRPSAPQADSVDAGRAAGLPQQAPASQAAKRRSAGTASLDTASRSWLAYFGRCCWRRRKRHFCTSRRSVRFSDALSQSEIVLENIDTCEIA